MKLSFVTSADDPLSALIRQKLPLNLTVEILPEGQAAQAGSVALFTATESETVLGRKQHLFMAAHKFPGRGIDIPAWASTTPFLVAVHPQAPIHGHRHNFREALKQMVDTCQAWSPWTEPAAPWNPYWPEGVPEEFVAWKSWAKECVPPPSANIRAGKYFAPVFTPTSIPASPTLLVIGCASFNRPHTDVVDQLDTRKMPAVVDELAEAIQSLAIQKVRVMVAGGDILAHEVLRSHLHPFIFMSVADAQQALGKNFTGPARLWGRVHQRSDAEVAEAFAASAAAMRRQLAEPLQARVAASVEVVSWVSMLLPYLDEAVALVEPHTDTLQAIYLERVRTRPSYATLHAVDPTAGLRRTLGNAALYVAEALHLRDHPDHMVANCEAFDTYWKGLAPIIQTIWGDTVPYIGMVREPLRQPWGY